MVFLREGAAPGYADASIAAPAMPILQQILETKETLAGVRQTFPCQVVARAPGEVVVLYLLPAARTVADLPLPAGTVTFGYFWSDRPYNVYHWMSPAGATLAFYVNLADGTRIDETTLAFRDLTVDVLIPPHGPPRVLDEDELPAALDGATATAIASARALVLAGAEHLRAEIDARSRALWPAVFGGARP
jgi:predicted RNA-binding protein associated with RNAse of E/G family